MKTLPQKILALLAIALLAAAISPQAQAAPIQGSIDFGGVVTFDTTSLQTATRVNLWNSSFVLQRSGDFTGFVANGANATMAAPWIFTPSTATPNLWSVGGFSFNLANSLVVSQSASFLNVTGTGTISGNGFDPTPGTWSFTSSSSNGSEQATFGFQAQSTAIPEASTMALLGLGALGLISRQIFRR
jgi:hypothetical protein